MRKSKAEMLAVNATLDALVHEMAEFSKELTELQRLLLNVCTILVREGKWSWPNPEPEPAEPEVYIYSPDAPDSEWWTVNEVADMIGKTTVTVRAMCKDGRLTPAVKINARGDWRIHADAFSGMT